MAGCLLLSAMELKKLLVNDKITTSCQTLFIIYVVLTF